MTAKIRPLRPAILMYCVFLLSGCAHFMPPPRDELPARQALERIIDNNVGLTHFKALGQIRMASADGYRSGRIAVAAVMPCKLRADWLNMMGQPLTSLAGDGETIRIWSPTDAKVHSLRQSPGALAKLIRIPLGIEDFQNIIIGRPAVPSYTAVQFKESRDDVDLLSLKNRWRKEVAIIRIERSTGRLNAMQVFDGHGHLKYETRWLHWRRWGKYLLPGKITLESDARDRLSLTVDRFWPDADIAPSIFVLKPPQG
jgi:hypothetical protein